MHTVIETPAYLAAAKDCGMTEAERRAAIDLISENPQAGDVMQGTGGCRKVRIPGRSKGDRANLMQAQRNQLTKITQVLISSYGRGKVSR